MGKCKEHLGRCAGRYWIGVIASVVLIFVGLGGSKGWFGWDGEIWAAIGLAITTLTGATIGGVAQRAKKKNCSVAPPGNGPAASVIVLALLSAALTGCPLIDPGGQVRRGIGQGSYTEWSADGGFVTQAEGSQTHNYEVAEGELVLTRDDEGNVVVDVEQSRVTSYMRAYPSAREAQTALGAAFEASIRQSEALAGVLTTAIETVVPLLINPPVPEVEPGPENPCGPAAVVPEE